MTKNKFKKLLYILRICLAAFLLILTTIAFAGVIPESSKILSLQLGPQLTKLLTAFSWTTLAIVFFILIITFLFGRFYCSTVCPFGILQEMIGSIFGRKTGNAPNFYKTRYLIASIVFGLLIGGSALGLKILDPYTNFGIIISNFLNPSSIFSVMYAAIVLLIITLLVVFKDRIFCTTICPIGTILGLFSKYGVFKLNIDSNCTKCKACENECPTGCIDSSNIDNERCIRCLKCVAKCPQNAIKYESKQEKEVEFSPSRRTLILGGAFLGITIASAIAGLNLIKKNSLKGKQSNKIGIAKINYSICIGCGRCITQCPTQALTRKPNVSDNTPEVNPNLCIGCGACEHICPVKAIKIEV